EGLLVAAHKFDVAKSPGGLEEFGPYAVQRVRWHLCNYVKRERRQVTYSANSLDHTDDENKPFSQSIVDKRQDDPSDIVEISDTKLGRIKMSQVEIRADKQTGQWVASLKAACFNAVS